MLQGTSAPVNIPGSQLSNFSPTNQSNLLATDSYSQALGHTVGSMSKISNSFSTAENLLFQPHIISPNLGDNFSMSPDIR